MTGVSIDSVEALPDARDEPGTAPGDRRFRPDIEGLRAVAVLLVVLYHAGFGGLSGGYVGVDVFFVISGFVITGVLLRERESSSSTSLLRFYARRSRRIIPAATLVIVVTVIATYAALGVVTGDQTAIDARWTAVFLANFHFASLGTNYLTAQQPPSPLLNFWSLAVEEQFYLVYPALFLLIAGLRTRWSLQARLAVGLIVVIATSFAVSVLQTASSPTVAYYSPFTRAWELALGALVAVGTTWLRRVPTAAGSVMTWVGLAAIAFGAIAFDSHTAYPGSLVAIPVVGACLVIAGGVNTPRWAAESLLGLAPFRWLGRLSYSLYLWHWPILILAAEAAGRTSLPFHQNIVWLAVALAASVISFGLVENPIRHLGASPKKSVVMGLGGGHRDRGPPIAGDLGRILAVAQLHDHAGVERTNPLSPGGRGVVDNKSAKRPPTCSSWRRLGVVAMKTLHAKRPLSQSTESICILGDTTARRLMVVYGDSHALMWLPAFDNTCVPHTSGWSFSPARMSG